MGQAEVYDATRKELLRGRKTMLRLAAAHLKESRKPGDRGRLVWVDIGGGTGKAHPVDAHLYDP